MPCSRSTTEGSEMGLRRSVCPVSSFQKNELYAWYLVYEYPGTAVRVLYFKALPFWRLATRTRAAPALMGRDQGRSSSLESFSEDSSNV